MKITKSIKITKKNIVVLCILLIALVVFFNSRKENELSDTWSESDGIRSVDGDASGYLSYLIKYGEKEFNGSQITIPGIAYQDAENAESFFDYEGKSAVVTGEQGSVTWNFTTEKSGLYAMSVEYFPIEGYGSSIERNLYLDGAFPYKEAEGIEFTRIYEDDTLNPSGLTARPGQIEKKRWNTCFVTDSFGYFGEAMYLYLEEGEHVITLESVKEPMAVANIMLISEAIEPLSYKETIDNRDMSGAKEVSGAFEDGVLFIQAENAFEKSEPTLYARSDTTSTKNQPFSYSEKLLNTIGGDAWKYSNQWISWEVSIPKSGYYNIGVRAKQNFVRDIYCNRTMYIDGEVPFAEASNLHFEYADEWKTKLFGEEEPFLFYLEAGVHTITLKVTAGDLEEILTQSEYILENLSDINLELLALLSTSPDTDRDYQIGKYMPDTVEALGYNAELLQGIYQEMTQLVGTKDSLTSQLEQLISLLKKMSETPDKIASLYSRYRDLVGNFGQWIMTVREHPLLLDYLVIKEPSVSLKSKEDGFFAKLGSGIMSFAYSFINDYSMLSESEDGTDGKEQITVWIGSGLTGGRDQAMALSQMIQERFTRESGISVNLQLVPESTILTATLAGRGPDVALQVKMNDPVDFALRNAVYDLTQFEDYEEVSERFFDGTSESFRYNDGVYALPDTMSFPMLFYRTDIMEDLGIKVEQLNTWESIMEILPVLQAENMNFALPATMQSYSMFLYQMGGEYYTEDQMASALSEKMSLDAFEFWTDFYSNYSLPVDFSFENRFRTGEMPIGVAEYTTYNLLSISAPEIKGKWAMIELPGIVAEDGTVNNISPITVQGSILMNACENKDAAWEFMKWWTDAESQYEFGKQLEAVMGAAARYNTANVEALKRMPWNVVDRVGLLTQTDKIRGIPQVPGGYFTERNLNFAKLAVINDAKNPRESLEEYSENITEEITLKRKEFGLNYIE